MQFLNLLNSNMVVDLLFNRMIVLDSQPKAPTNQETYVDKLILLNLILNLMMNVAIISYVGFRIYSTLKNTMSFEWLQGKTIESEQKSISNPPAYPSDDTINNTHTKIYKSSMGDSNYSNGYPNSSSMKGKKNKDGFKSKERTVMRMMTDSSDFVNLYALGKTKRTKSSELLYTRTVLSKRSIQEGILSDMNVSQSMRHILLQHKKKYET